MSKKSELFTEDPYYLPRYCGYLPQYKYRIGKTYGHHSLDILTDPNVQKSGTYVLADMEAQTTGPDRRRLLLQSRQYSWGNQIHTDQMLPGYTGYIPKNQHYFANSYAEVCRSSLAHHEHEQREMNTKRSEMRKLLGMQSGNVRPTTEEDKRMVTSRYPAPLPPQSREAKPYKAVEFRPPGSPYFMDDSNKMKWFKSGYTGFVPRTRGLIAMDYPKMTNRGLSVFTRNLTANESKRHEPVILNKRELSRHDKTVIYPSNRGMIPHYTGYIPGYKYKIGHTYGRHTLNTLKISPAEGCAATVTA